jgi:hypothetical protein
MKPNQDLESIAESSPKNALKKASEWIKRWGYAELAGTFVAYISSYLIHKATGSEIFAAIGATWGENLGFYGMMYLKDLRKDRFEAFMAGKEYGVKGRLKTIRNLFYEFGAAECLDTLVIRPSTMGFGTKFLGRELGVPIGKLTADISFYLPTIVSYELRKKLFNSRNDPPIKH